jgi:hypothetical protein
MRSAAMSVIVSRFRFGAVGFTDRLLCLFARAFRGHLRTDDPAAIDHLSRLRADGSITAALASDADTVD